MTIKSVIRSCIIYTLWSAVVGPGAGRVTVLQLHQLLLVSVLTLSMLFPISPSLNTRTDKFTTRDRFISSLKKCLFFPFTAYQAYKKSCHRSADEDSEALSVEDGDGERAKEKELAVENNTFECDENGNSEEKGKDIEKNTQL